MKYDIITIGGATEDISFYTQEGLVLDNHKDILRPKLLAFEYGAKIVINGAASTFGGGAANAAVNLAGLGFKTGIIADLGKDIRAEKIIANLKSRKVMIDLLEQDPKKETGFSFVIISGPGDRVIFSDRGANVDLRIVTKELPTISQATWLYLTSLSGDYWSADLKKIFSLKGPRVIWNPGHEQLRAGLKVVGEFLKQTDILCLNKDEALELVLSSSPRRGKATELEALNNTKKLLKIIKSFGPKIVLITKGKIGAEVYDGRKFYSQGIVKNKKRIDTTGVGDCFNSTFLAGYLKYQGDIKKALALSMKAASKKISHVGAQNGLLTKKDL